jgi:hypothetical protein
MENNDQLNFNKIAKEEADALFEVMNRNLKGEGINLEEMEIRLKTKDHNISFMRVWGEDDGK